MSNQRNSYSLKTLSRADLIPDPIEQFEAWFREAQEAGVAQPEVMTLATATQDGTLSARMVILRSLDERGFVFYSNYESQKGRELAENPSAALVFYWQEQGRQVRVAGSVSRVSQEESERHFASRPRNAQIAVWASRQSEVVPSREYLEQCLAEARIEYEGREVPLPPYWGGFCVSPDNVEFWQQRSDRLHDRFLYRRQTDDEWQIERLAP